MKKGRVNTVVGATILNSQCPYCFINNETVFEFNPDDSAGIDPEPEQEERCSGCNKEYEVYVKEFEEI